MNFIIFLLAIMFALTSGQTPSPTLSPITPAPTSSPTITCSNCVNGGFCGIRNTLCECPFPYYGLYCELVKSCACIS